VITIGQFELLEYLKANKGKSFDGYQLAEIFGQEYSSVSKALSKLIRDRQIEFSEKIMTKQNTPRRFVFYRG